MTGPTLTLTATLRGTGVDARRGVVRLHPEVLTALGLRAGDAVTLIGNRTTAGIAAVAAAGASRALLYADDLLLGNLGCRDGGQVQVSPAPRVAADRVMVAGPVELQAAVSPDMLRLAMLGKVISAGDDVSLLPQDVLPDASAGRLIAAARASLRNTVGFAWTSALVTVIAADPAHAGLVTMDTVVGWAGGQVTHSTATPLGVRPLAGAIDQGVLGAIRPAGAQRPGHRSADDGVGAGDDAGAGDDDGTDDISAHDASADDDAGAALARSESDGPGVRSGTAGSRTLPHGVVPAGTEPAPSLDDLPGLRTQANQLIELLDLGFHHAEVLGRLGTSITLGALVTGPSGSGKSAMVRAVAADVGATVYVVWAPEVAALTNNDAAARLRGMASTVAQQVAAGQPAVLLISDVESVVPRNGDSSGVEAAPLATVFRQTVGDVLRSGAAVVCTTSRPESVDPALRTPGLLDHEIVVPLPDAVGRRDQLGVLTRQMPLAADVRLDDLAARTPGFVAADLAALVREAGVRAALRHRATVGSSAGGTAVTSEAVANEAVANEAATIEAAASVGLADFMAALEVVRPTSMAESTLELAKVTLEDVGDMADVKQVLTEAILWPLTYPDTFARLGIEPPRGVLLYGPPGCGKTYLVKAIAGSGKSNVLSVKGAELLSKWVGDSERAVRELFRRARDAAPTLIFFDEVDALAPLRGQSTDGGTTDRVVASLLTELDGVEPMRNVVVIGATNRPDLVDSALLRPGRLERLVYIPPPDAAARAEILRAAAKSVPLDDDVDLDELGGELDGFSAADCTALIREAALAAMRESLDAATVTAANVATARTRVRPSLDPVQVAALAAYATTHAPRS
ncbi:MAG TPA: AAA family ATPase [Micromonosporaceae bacterium]|nr:AAA family ATPase [Micromonosporaceae bacterium]